MIDKDIISCWKPLNIILLNSGIMRAYIDNWAVYKPVMKGEGGEGVIVWWKGKGRVRVVYQTSFS